MNIFEKLSISVMSAHPLYHHYIDQKESDEDPNFYDIALPFAHVNVYLNSQKSAYLGKCAANGIFFITSGRQLIDRVVQCTSSIIVEGPFSTLLSVLSEIYSDIKENSFLSLSSYTLLNTIVFLTFIWHCRQAEPFLKMTPFLIAFNSLLVFDLGYFSVIPFSLSPIILYLAVLGGEKINKFIENNNKSLKKVDKYIKDYLLHNSVNIPKNLFKCLIQILLTHGILGGFCSSKSLCSIITISMKLTAISVCLPIIIPFIKSTLIPFIKSALIHYSQPTNLSITNILSNFLFEVWSFIDKHLKQGNTSYIAIVISICYQMFSNVKYMLSNPHNALAAVSISCLAIGVQYALLLIGKKILTDSIDRAIIEARESDLGASYMPAGSLRNRTADLIFMPLTVLVTAVKGILILLNYLCIHSADALPIVSLLATVFCSWTFVISSVISFLL